MLLCVSDALTKKYFICNHCWWRWCNHSLLYRQILITPACAVFSHPCYTGLIEIHSAHVRLVVVVVLVLAVMVLVVVVVLHIRGD